ncbi:MAG TPA: hypothetical protein DE147_08090 [Gammaproteobacteria bacterium]|nr:hypothetical protein [Gammaproteobacteria bacterium]
MQEIDTIDTVSPAAHDAPAAAYADALFTLAVQQRASDIHLEPQQQGLVIRLRVDGLLHRVPSPAEQIARRLCARIKIMAAMDIAEQRRPQDGRISTLGDGFQLDARVSSLPTLWGEKLVLRLVPANSSLLTLDALGLNQTQHAQLLEALSQPQGLILVTGPTGSGKTQTLYSALQWLNAEHRNISTAEEPIEIPLTGINQVAIRPSIGLDFAATLRALLRQDPDVMMVGEIRDDATASMAIRAAQTGHLVLSTLHTNSARATLLRLNQLGVSERDLTESLTLVLAQRLLRRLCGGCKKASQVTTKVGVRAQSAGFEANAAGCQRSLNGYHGRLGVFELSSGPGLFEPASNLGPTADTMQQGSTKSPRDNALTYHRSGDTSLAEVDRVLPSTIEQFC